MNMKCPEQANYKERKKISHCQGLEGKDKLTAKSMKFLLGGDGNVLELNSGEHNMMTMLTATELYILKF